MKKLLLLLLLLLPGCERVTGGKIVEKNYYRAWTESGIHWIYNRDGTSIPIPYSEEHPERYEIIVVGGKDGKTRGWIDVPARTYDKVKVGELYGAEAD